MPRDHPGLVRFRAVRAALHAENGRFLGEGYEKIRRESAKARAKIRRPMWGAAKLLEERES